MSRFQLSRAGVLNVWQYDEQVFEFADGRLLLRGANGAGKSKTLEMLLPFVLDGDKARMTASGRHHTSLLWLMLDGYTGQNRAGYLWVEFAHGDDVITCGVGIRASQSTRDARAWYFTFPGRVDAGASTGLALEDAAGPLARDRLRAAVEAGGGQFFESPRQYRQHVGRLLFGLEPGQYDELLRLLYWLRQPQVGEDIEPARLAEQLVQALPQLDDDAVRAAGDTFDELAAFGEQLDRQRRAADGVLAFAAVYADYAREVLRARGAEVAAQHTERTRRSREAEQRTAAADKVAEALATAEGEHGEVGGELGRLAARLGELRADPLLRTERELANRRALAVECARTAGSAAESAARSRGRAEQSGARVRRDADTLRADLTRYAVDGQRHAAELAEARSRATLAVPDGLHQPTLAGPDDAGATTATLVEHQRALTAVRPVLGELRAAVEVVAAARTELDTATTHRQRAEQMAADAERYAEQERNRLADARRAADQAEAALRTGLDGWRADPRAVTVEPPDAWTAEAVLALPATARAGAAPTLRAHHEREKSAGARRTAADRAIRELRARRAAVAAEPDPAPGAPSWHRDPRDDADGAPLWRLVDFADHPHADRPDADDHLPAGRETDGRRAAVEAALEASGLLDAWVRPDGAVLTADRRDTVLPTGPAVTGPTLADVLIADPPAHAPVSAEVVRGVLARIGYAEPAGGNPDPGSGAASGDAALVTTDGGWRLGPLTGRATKPVAQYIGATARAAERARRLADLDDQLAEHTTELGAATAEEAAARAAAAAIESWLAAVPSGAALLTAWTRHDEQAQTTSRADRRAEDAEQAAVAARATEAARRRELDQLAAVHELPTEPGPLAARREALRELDRVLTAHADGAAGFADRLRRWAEDAQRWEHDLAEAADATDVAQRERARADEAAAAADELEQTVGAPVREIRARIEAAQDHEQRLRRRAGQLSTRIAELHADGGAARQAAADAAARLAEHEPVLADAVARLGQAASTPGLLRSGLPASAESGLPATPEPDVHHAASPEPGQPHAEPHQPSPAPPDTSVFELAGTYRAGQPVPAAVLGLARRIAELPPPARPGTDNAVLAAWQEAASGPAGDLDPRVTEIGGALAAIGRDESGEHPIGVLSARLTAAVARDAELLTDRERRLFEEHILGDLGESLRSRRMQAEELVAEMNQLLRGVTTSQGIAVTLRWRLREDVPADARRAVELLVSPVGALLADERRELRDALHRLIEASRVAAPEDSYSEHLSRALDYRRWFAFTVRYTRPEAAGVWHELHRRSALSQGEQKVVCYLPLFAAAAAHFSSLAGAAPHSPRFVLLDDAFPKIDVRTHPLLFGLLVQLDLDFVVTSERLWGDHTTVPSLAIYEALRDPNERGIAQYRHHWDGHRLQAVT